MEKARVSCEKRMEEKNAAWKSKLVIRGAKTEAYDQGICNRKGKEASLCAKPSRRNSREGSY